MIYINRDDFFKAMCKRFGCVPNLTNHSTSLRDDIHLDEALNMIPPANVVDRAMVKALEEDLERTGNELANVEAERDALLEELQRLADCSSCKFNAPDAVDGCSALMPCKDGSMWEWKGVKQ